MKLHVSRTSFVSVYIVCENQTSSLYFPVHGHTFLLVFMELPVLLEGLQCATVQGVIKMSSSELLSQRSSGSCELSMAMMAVPLHEMSFCNLMRIQLGEGPVAGLMVIRLGPHWDIGRKVQKKRTSGRLVTIWKSAEWCKDFDRCQILTDKTSFRS